MMLPVVLLDWEVHRIITFQGPFFKKRALLIRLCQAKGVIGLFILGTFSETYCVDVKYWLAGTYAATKNKKIRPKIFSKCGNNQWLIVVMNQYLLTLKFQFITLVFL